MLNTIARFNYVDIENENGTDTYITLHQTDNGLLCEIEQTKDFGEECEFNNVELNNDMLLDLIESVIKDKLRG